MQCGKVSLLRQLRVLHTTKRWFADKGSTRRDFSDRGFQEEGYISENCFRSTALHRFKEPKDCTHTPVFAGSDEVTDSSSGKSPPSKAARSPKLAPELPKVFDLSLSRRKDYKRKRVMSRKFKNYRGFEYEGSGLDEHTSRVTKRKEKRLDAAANKQERVEK